MAPLPKGYVDEQTGSVYGANRQPTGGNITASTTGAGGAVPQTPTQAQNPSASNGMSPYTGFAARYQPGMLDNVYDNPWYLLPDVFQGISTSSPGYQALRDFGGDPLALYNIMVGGGQQIDQGAGAFANFMQQLYQNLGTPGGQGFDAKELLRTIFGQQQFGAESKNTLGQILGSGDMNTQIRTLFNLLRDVASVSMNPLAASGYQSAIAQAGDRYGNAMLKSGAGNTQNPTEWIRANMPWLAVQ